MSGDELKLNVTNISIGGSTESLRPAEGETTNFYRQQDIFTKAKEKTMATPEVEDVTMEVTDDGASKRDLQAYDIAARPYNISGFKVMAGSDMYNKFLEINGDDFTLGINDRGEQVMLFDKAKSDGKIKMFSVEKDENGNEYYAIRDNDGVVHKFDKDGKDITKNKIKALAKHIHNSYAVPSEDPAEELENKEIRIIQEQHLNTAKELMKKYNKENAQ